jgi:ParB family chromosome partitioning protein
MSVLGRRLLGDPDHNYELIYGARRLFVARHLNVPLTVELRNVSDRDGIIAMELENGQRRDISPYERALRYAEWLRLGYFESQQDLARALILSPSQVSRLLALARLPGDVVSAFGNVRNIREGWGVRLVEAMRDPGRREPMIQAAREMASAHPRLRPSHVYAELVAIAKVEVAIAASKDDFVQDDSGNALFQVKHGRKSIALILPVDRVSEKCLHNIRDAITSILQSPNTPELPGQSETPRKGLLTGT